MDKLIKLLDRSEAFHLTVVLGWCLAMMAVTTLALLPVEHLQLPVFDWWDKAQHALAFAVLTGWALLMWSQWSGRVVLGMLAFGAGIELAQWVVGWRFAEWADLAADAVGVLVAWGGIEGMGSPVKPGNDN